MELQTGEWIILGLVIVGILWLPRAQEFGEWMGRRLGKPSPPVAKRPAKQKK